MALTAGTRIGVYEIGTQIGVGGMGEVYRATDGNLKRSVAIKVLPAAVAGDADRLARFQREAEVLAALNHPNIAAIYGLEKTAEFTALVMELVEGEDLSQRIARGAIPIDEALAIAKQIAEALECAHEQGIIHRDLKPANIKVRPDGTVKVLDFGLAKAMDSDRGSGIRDQGSGSVSPTLTSPALVTGVGMLLGTAAYMSPEQAKGRLVDKRSDVWAFGAVLYEMLTGQRAFEGEDVSDTLAHILMKDPAWTALPATVPSAVVTVLRRCLQKDRKQRVRDIGDVALALEGAFETTVPGAADQEPAARPRPLWRRALPVAATAVLVSAMAIAATRTLRPTPAAPPLVVTRFTLPLGAGQQFSIFNNPLLAISPDGRQIVYAANNQLYLRSMADFESRPIPGTQRTTAPYSPAFSPDSRSIAFYSPADRAVKKIAVTGGTAVTLCPAEGFGFGSLNWDASGIVFRPRGKDILRVSPSGGEPETLVRTGESEVYGPQVLPGGEWVLFTLATAATAEGWDKAQIVVQSLKTGERRTLVSGGSDGRYLPTGHLVYALGGVVFAVPFDLSHLAVTGGAVPIVEGVLRANASLTGVAQFSVSTAGSLVFIAGPATTSAGQFDLALIDRAGAAQLLQLPPAAYEYPRLSPDGKLIAVGSDDGKEASVWIEDVSGATSIRRLTQGGRNRVPVWAADGEHVAFQSDRDGDLAIWWQRVDGTTPAERLTKPDDKGIAHVPESWSPNGKTLLFSVGKASGYSLAALSLSDKKVMSVGGIESGIPPSAAFSPDGKWVAYSMTVPESRDTLASLFVQPFPPTGATYPISKGNGFHATWAPDGKELFYATSASTMVVVPVTSRPTFTFGIPVPVPKVFLDRGASLERPNDITRDGKFLAVIAAGAAAAVILPQMQVVVNWFEELKARVPAK